MDTRIHLVHLVLSLEPGGLENGVVNLVNGLDASRFRSTVCCLKRRGAFAARIVAPGARVIEADVPPGLSIGGLWRLTRMLRAQRPCIVHTRNAEAFLYGAIAAKLAGVEVLIHSEHGRSFDDPPRRLAAQRWLSRFARRIFAVTGELRDQLARHVGIARERIDVLYNGVDLRRFDGGDPRARARARELLGVRDDQWVVGSVGRLVAVKNYGALLHAVAALDDPRVVVALIGDGPQADELRTLADRLGIAARLRMPGHRDDIANWLPGLDLFVLPSLSEGMSNTLLEAMAAGRPVAASEVGGNPEVVRHGVDGLLFAPGDIDALTRVLRDLRGDPARCASLTAAGARRAREQFGLGGMIARYQRYYADAWATRGA